MMATNFEYRHQRLVHQFIVGAAFLSYLIDRDDIVWRFVRNGSTPRLWERSLFIVATILIAVGAGLCTGARALPRPGPQYRGEFLYAIGLGSLMPLSGFIILVAGESLRILRLMRRQTDDQEKFDSSWGKAFRNEATKWGILVTMIVFAITLKDRVAEVLAAASFLVGLLFNLAFLG
jgi:hypothetical protein